jgi:cytochrome c oxidase subunit 2
VPGHTNFTWFKVKQPGTFRGQCAELCGRNHADMIAKVVAVEPDEFKTWLETKKREIEAANKAAQTRREKEAKQIAEGETPADDQGRKSTGGETPAGSAGPEEEPPEGLSP